MPQKLGFYELLEPHVIFGLANQNATGEELVDLRDAEVSLTNNFPGTSKILSRFITKILDYLSVEELYSSIGENAIVYRGTAKFGGEGQAAPTPPPKQSITSENGQELRWLDDMIVFRLTVPRRGEAISFDTSGLSGNDLTDLQQLNDLLTAFADPTPGEITDHPGNDFRMELLIRTVQVSLPRDLFIPAKVAADGWLEPDESLDNVVFEFPRMAFVLEQQGEAGNFDFSLKSWDSPGFDDPGDVDTARLFSLSPPYFLHSSGTVGFGIDRLVADFSNDITPPEVLEHFGTGDDFNGIWMPLIQVFIAPGRTKGLAFSAWGKDLLFDLDKGISGELGVDFIYRVENNLSIEPVFYKEFAKERLEFKRGTISKTDGKTTVGKGEVVIPGNGEMQLIIQGSDPPYSLSVKFKGEDFSPTSAEEGKGPKWILTEDQTGLLEIQVKDNGEKNTWLETIEIRHVTDKATIKPKTKYKITFNPDQTDEVYKIELLEEEVRAPVAEFTLTKKEGKPTFKIAGLEIPPINNIYPVSLVPGANPLDVEAKWDLSSPPDLTTNLNETKQKKLVKDNTLKATIRLYFRLAYPIKPYQAPEHILQSMVDLGKPYLKNMGIYESGVNEDLESITSGIEGALNMNPSTIIKAIDEYILNTQDDIFISGFASHEKKNTFDKDDVLSELRAKTLYVIIKDRLNVLSIDRKVHYQAYSHNADKEDNESDSDPRFRVAIAISTPKVEDKLRMGNVKIEDITPPFEEPKKQKHPATPAPEGPTIFRRISGRLRFERDELVLGEISGQFDFNTASEQTLTFIKSSDSRNDSEESEKPLLKTAEGASKTGEQGILDYRLTISYDRATRKLTQEIALGFDQDNRDGWVNLEREDPSTIFNTLGSFLVFAPLLNDSIDALVDKSGEEATAEIILASAEVAAATALGLTGAIKFRKWIFFGLELSSTQLLPDQEEGTRLGEISALFDYAVDFEVDIDLKLLTIRSKQKDDKPVPVRVRYRGFGFKLNFGAEDTYLPVFDTSKGFDLGIAEPGALEVSGPLGPILKILAVRMARQNPLILEFDLALNVNLGIITVETLRVRLPVDPPGLPTIIPTALSVDIPGILTGKGYLNIKDNGFKGSIDLLLAPLKLRIQASVGVENIEAANRRITAFFMSIGAEFSAPIPLLGSGLGLYGLLGMFGMHYKRTEEPAVNANLPIALDWFYNKAKGEPHLMAVDGIPTWIPAPDRWSFGVGVVLGTMEGAFVMNLKGMLVIDLPGPRILIFVKAQILKSRPPSGKPVNQKTGILAVVDINFQANYISIGLMFNYEIKELLKLEVPIDASFNTENIEDWHIYAGSINNKASAEILGIAKGTAYLMFDGEGIPEFPIKPLTGFSIAAGIAASLVFGDKESGLYAEVSGALDVGVSTNPLHFSGRLELSGSIHLWIMSIGASAKLVVEAPEPLYVHGEICGKIDLWLTELKGCVDVTIGNPHPLPDPMDLITGLSLQSHSPALLEGQATDQPVDTSLGISNNISEIIRDVPIDVIPVLQMRYPPVFAQNATGLIPSSTAPTLSGSDGWVALGGTPDEEGAREVKYEIAQITINPPLPNGNTTIPLTWWQPARPGASGDSQATDKGINLALNSWIPVPFPRAYQRSDEQRQTIRERFEVICKEIAPAASVLWTFIEQPPGYSPSGWLLEGIIWPDPPGTLRNSSPDQKLKVTEPHYPHRTDQLMNEWATQLTGQIYEPAKVIPLSLSREEGIDGKVLQLPSIRFEEGLMDDTLSEELQQLVQSFLAEAGFRERIVIHSGDAAFVRVLLRLNRRRKQHKFIFVTAYDDRGHIVEQLALPGNYIKGFDDVPDNWRDENGPWRKPVQSVLSFLNSSTAILTTHSKSDLFLMEWEPAEGIARFEITYRNPDLNEGFHDFNPVKIGVIELLSRAEIGRVAFQESYKSDMEKVVVNALQEGDQRALFEPETLYTVTVKYKGEVRKSAKPGERNENKDMSQSFRFQTAALAPPRLDPWVLSTSPQNDEESHFTEDLVEIIFNDAAIIQLFKAYGKTLRAVLRKANGNHPTETVPMSGDALTLLPPLLRTPFTQSLLEVVEDMPCIPQIIETETHLVFRVDIPLERGTAYILDIEAEPPVKVNALNPLFRFSFNTSRFISAEELAQQIEQGFIEERATFEVLNLPVKKKSFYIPDDTKDAKVAQKHIECVTNAEMEASLIAALGSIKPPAHQPGITFLWDSNIPARPLGLLIDAPESLLRFQDTPIEMDFGTPDGDFIQFFRNENQLRLELVETSSGLAERIIYTTGGCRALVFFKENPAGRLKLAIRQYRHALKVNQMPFLEYEILDIAIPEGAPWED